MIFYISSFWSVVDHFLQTEHKKIDIFPIAFKLVGFNNTKVIESDD